MRHFSKIDLHMHTTISDGTDTPKEILACVKEAGLDLFSVTDHDAVRGCRTIKEHLKKGDPGFITGIEFSCKDGMGQYHILGYGYDPEDASIKNVVALGHGYRMEKLKMRLDYLEEAFGFTFPKEEVERLRNHYNPGKPHIGNLMVRLGYAKTKDEAIKNYINGLRVQDAYVLPEEAIEGILGAGGIPVLAHPSYGSGDQIILGAEMEARLRRLLDFGLKGLEAYYSGFTKKIRDEVLSFAEKYDLYVTAGSDYHGTNKLILLGDTGLAEDTVWPEGLERFLRDVKILDFSEMTC